MNKKTSIRHTLSCADNTEPGLLGNEEVRYKRQTKSCDKTVDSICTGCPKTCCQSIQFPIRDGPLDAKDAYGAYWRRDGYADDETL